MALGALLIQIEYGYSDEETVEQIKENPYLQYFCGLLGYEYKAPFDASAMTRFRKRLTPKRLEAINNFIIQQAETAKQAPQHTEKDTDKKDDSHHDDTPPSISDKEGTLIVDATCAPSRIKYPRDMELLNEGREKLEHIITVLHTPTDGKKTADLLPESPEGLFEHRPLQEKQGEETAAWHSQAIAIHC